MGSDAELDDVVQEVFLDAAGALASVREADSLRGWLGRITVHRIHKRLARRRRSSWLLREQREIVVTVSDPAVKTRVTDLYRALERLPPETRSPGCCT